MRSFSDTLQWRDDLAIVWRPSCFRRNVKCKITSVKLYAGFRKNCHCEKMCYLKCQLNFGRKSVMQTTPKKNELEALFRCEPERILHSAEWEKISASGAEWLNGQQSASSPEKKRSALFHWYCHDMSLRLRDPARNNCSKKMETANISPPFNNNHDNNNILRTAIRITLLTLRRRRRVRKKETAQEDGDSEYLATIQQQQRQQQCTTGHQLDLLCSLCESVVELERKKLQRKMETANISPPYNSNNDNAPILRTMDDTN